MFLKLLKIVKSLRKILQNYIWVLNFSKLIGIQLSALLSYEFLPRHFSRIVETRNTFEWLIKNSLWYFLFHKEFVCLYLRKKLIGSSNSWINQKSLFVWNHAKLFCNIVRSCFFHFLKNIWSNFFSSSILSCFRVTEKYKIKIFLACWHLFSFFPWIPMIEKLVISKIKQSTSFSISVNLY